MTCYFEATLVTDLPMATRGKKQVAQRWYLGGIASAGAACGTHPLDLLKVTVHVMLYRHHH